MRTSASWDVANAACVSGAVDTNQRQLKESGGRVRGTTSAIPTVVDTLEADPHRQLEALEAKIELLLQHVRDITNRDEATRTAHSRLDQRLKNHEARLLSLERPRRR